MRQQMQAIVTTSVARQIAEALRTAILAGQLAVDERLPTEEELAQQFGVSRPTIREALKRLAAEHLVHSRRGASGGNFVKRPSIPEVVTALASSMRLLTTMGKFSLEDIVEARLEFDKLCCRLAVDRADAKDIAALREELAKQRHPDISDLEFCASDVHFHQLLVAAAHNSLLALFMLAMGEGLQAVTNLMVFRFRDRDVIIDQHARLVDAIEDRDAKLALSIIAEQAAYHNAKYGEARKWKRRSGKQASAAQRLPDARLKRSSSRRHRR